MKTYLECIPCFLIQALRAGRLAGLDDPSIYNMLVELGGRIKDIPMDSPPPLTAIGIYDLINQHLGDDDPFKKVKEESTKAALALYPRLKKDISDSDDPIGLALRLAIVGNVIDFGAPGQFDLEAEVEGILEQPFGRWEEEEFNRALSSADWILYLGDNTGETVFDRLLIETLDQPVTYVVRGGPIINDATMEDAVAAGIDKVAKVISSGYRAPGTILERSSEELRDLFERAPLIISKGQGNFETLSEVKGRLFFLLKTKCPVVARHLGTKVGDMVLCKSSVWPV